MVVSIATMYHHIVVAVLLEAQIDPRLMLKSIGIDDLLHFDFMDPPPPETLIKVRRANLE